MQLYEIKKHIENLGLNIESQETDQKFINFYCNDGTNRFSISIKDKGLLK